MTRWRFRLWCPDCTDEDPMGCFDGGTELSEGSYGSEAEADKAGFDCTKGSIWKYEVVQDREGE